MEEMSQYLLIGGTIVFGLLATVIYYLARYSFKAHDKDPEVLPSVHKDKLPEKTETSVAAEKLVPRPETSQSAPESVPLPEAGPSIKVEEAPKLSVEKPIVKRDLKDALANTKANLFGRIKASLVGKSTLSEDDMELLEEVLYTSDMGPTTVQRLMGAVGDKLGSSEKKELASVQKALKSEMISIFGAVQDPSQHDLTQSLGLIAGKGTQLWMVVGVNGAGKTTSIGKLAFHAANQGLKVLVAAGDTFRAAAGEQLKAWTERAQVEIFFPENVTDPSAVAFDACQKGVAGQFDLVIVDTAGRLHTQDNLMEELKKMKRVVQKVIPEGPHQTLIVLDANSGQNALMQAKNFHQALDLSGAILTKLDGTAKGGVAVGLACELALPIRAIGVGEGIEDLRAFESSEFVDSII